MNYAFLGRIIPHEILDKTIKLSRYNMQDAAIALQWNLYNGLCNNLGESIHFINVLPIGSYPQYYKKMFVSQSSFSTLYSCDNTNVGFCNLKLMRNYILPNRIEAVLTNWCKADEKNRMLFVYTLFTPFLRAVENVKKFFPTLKVCAIVADLPNMSSLAIKKSKIAQLYEKIEGCSAYNYLGCIDGYVLLTKYMAEYMKINKPFCVVEGIATSSDLFKSNNIFSNGEKRILYSGTLHRKFGVLNLLEAFKLIEGEEYRLIICGIGDSEEEIREASKGDPRIVFKGQLPREEVLKLQLESTVLVNPRQNNEEFTRYSFPSKNLEYLSSGVPLVAYKLDGIPDEYDSYINYVGGDSPSALKDKLVQICELDVDERKQMGKSAQKFVMEKKNAIVQTRTIVELINLL